MIWAPDRASPLLTFPGSPAEMRAMWKWHPLWTG